MNFRNRIDRQMVLEFTGCRALENSIEPQLSFSVIARNPFPYSITVLSMEGGLSIRHPQRGTQFIAPLRRLSLVEPPYPMGIHASDMTQDHFTASLNWNLVEQIERIRDGRELVLRAKVQFLCVELENKNPPGMQSTFWMAAEATRNQSAEMVFANREWLEVLRQWGFADRRVMEVNLPRLDALRKGYVTALNYLTEADRKLGEGHYDDVLGEARKCLHVLGPAIKSRLDSLKADELNVIWHQKLGKFQMAVKELCDKGPHVGNPAGRAEALLVLTVVKEMLAYFSAEGIL